MHQEDGGLFHPNAYSDVSGQFKRPWICCVNSVRWSFPRKKKKKILTAQSSEDAGIEKCSAMHTFKWTKVLQCHFDQTWELSYGHSPGLPPLSVGPTWRLIKYQSFQQKYTLTESPGATAYCLKWNVKKEGGKKVKEKQITSKSKLIGLLQSERLKKIFQEKFGKMHVQHFGLSAQSVKCLCSPLEWNSWEWISPCFTGDQRIFHMEIRG